MKQAPAKKILIANRGEIALRILRCAKMMGYQVLSVYSEADQHAPHVRLADESICLGPAASSESYLKIEKLVEIAQKHQCWAVHPGYGFLAENQSFAKALEDKGIVFIGPMPQTIADMGDKVSARKIATQAGLPMIPGSSTLDSAQNAQEYAEKIGYPVLIKAKAGGGGKGMRVVHESSQIKQAFELAQSEAQKAFGDPGVYVERYLESPRHVEVQVFADHHGKVWTLFDRDCSIQRRHQKIIEEAPAPFFSDETREKMAKASQALCMQVKYRGAGTLEFLVDHEENFYFLEMNTRLQVEHPVTEWVTGQDLVALQILAAENKKLALEPRCQGHSIEVRIYAEDCDQNFAPSPGKVTDVSWPSGAFVRVDSYVEKGSEISLFYDPMIAKISTWGVDREAATQRMIWALKEFSISGVISNRDFLLRALQEPAFSQSAPTTNFIETHQLVENSQTLSQEELALAYAAAVLVGSDDQKIATPLQQASNWWRSGIQE
ncbi:MAG: ATP-grasp domain-containing protein [Bdellovibrionales bacterium]|nr:ATP-grasp domain-containing protein [Bdellovibrionales bacterium]